MSKRDEQYTPIHGNYYYYGTWSREKDKALAKENAEARKHYTQTGLRALTAAICLGAVKEYVKAPPQRKKKLEEFFDGEMFSYFTNGLPIEEVLKTLNENGTSILHKKANHVGEKGPDCAKTPHKIYKVILDGVVLGKFPDSMAKARRLADSEQADVYVEDQCIYSSTKKYEIA